MEVQFLGHKLELGGKYIDASLRPCNNLLHDVASLRRQLSEDGYLLVRGLQPRDSVLEARRQILEKLNERGALAPGEALMDGFINPKHHAPASTSVRGQDELKRSPAFRQLFGTSSVIDFFTRLLGGPVGILNFQWLRVAGSGAESAIHSDIVFMGRGTKNLYTCWTPLGDVSIDMGPIALLPGSQKIEKLKSTYWQADVDRDLIEGHLSKDPVEIVERFKGRWATTGFQAGDVLIFGMYVLHASLANMSNRYRLSADVRYQLASEPFDERWVGENPTTHYRFWQPGVKLEPVAVTRAKWGL